MTWGDRLARDTTVMSGKLEAPTIAEPGKGIRPSPTGDVNIDRGGGGPGGGYLARDVRVALEHAFQRRVDLVSGNWVTGMLECRMEKLLEHEDTDLPWMETMLIGLVGALCATQFAKILELLRARAEMAAEHALQAGVTLPPSMTASLFGATHPLSFEGLVKGAADNSKTKVFTAMAGRQAEGDHEKKTEAVGYLDTLADKTRSAYNHIAEKVPGIADDPTMVAMFVAFDPDLMPISFFKAQITSQMERYMASNAANIGRKYRQPTRAPTKLFHDGGANYETRVAWVVDRGRSRLAYVDREFLVKYAYDDEAYIGPKAKSLATRPNKDWSVESTEDSDSFVEYVEDDLIDIALTKHKALWADEVKTYHLALDPAGKPMLLERKIGPAAK